NCDAFIVFRSFPSQENAPENSNQKRSSLKGSDQVQINSFREAGWLSLLISVARAFRMKF
ncbi:hypothetical protein, partial [Agrobacterium tumefaciens]|uniref:hypothetical protein n=1 Tax=Agrobacterium tumefaciens TaxID=358 RepID=UPI001BABB431